MPLSQRRLATAALCLVLMTGATASHADDVYLGSVRLRGGFDSNPRLIDGGRGSAFMGFDAAFAAGQETEDLKLGVVGEASRIQYLEGSVEPSERYKSSFELANKDQSDVLLRLTSAVEAIRSYETHAFDMYQRVRAEYTGGNIRPFFTGELRYATLNETNAILIDFLPEDQRYVRMTAIPGVTIKSGDKLEYGASLNLSANRYTEEFDLFGFRRDNERLQPFVFVRYESEHADFFGNVSQLWGRWHEPEFDNVSRLLFEASLTLKSKPVTFEFSAKRFGAETTFPISPMTIVTAYGVKAAWTVNPKHTVTVFAREFSTEYLNSPFSSRMLSYGLAHAYALTKDWTLGTELYRARATPLVGDDAYGIVGMVSVSKRFAPGETLSKPQAAALPPAK